MRSTVTALGDAVLVMRSTLTALGDAVLVGSVATVAWAIAGTIFGWERWLALPLGWSFSATADWRAQAVWAAAAAILLIPTVWTTCRCCRAAPPRGASELDAASLLSRLTFWWTTPTMHRCRAAGKLEPNDLPALAARDDPEILYRRLVAACLPDDGRPLSPWRLLAACMFSIHKPLFFQCLAAGWLFLGAMLLDPLILRWLLSSGEEQDTPGLHSGGSDVFTPGIVSGDAALFLLSHLSASAFGPSELLPAEPFSPHGLPTYTTQPFFDPVPPVFSPDDLPPFPSPDDLPPSADLPPFPAPSALSRQLGLIALLALNMLLRVSCMELCFFASTRCANNARAALVIAVFRSTVGGT